MISIRIWLILFISEIQRKLVVGAHREVGNWQQVPLWDICCWARLGGNGQWWYQPLPLFRFYLLIYLFSDLMWDLLESMTDGMWDSTPCKPSGVRGCPLSRPQMGMYLTPQPSGMSYFSVTVSSNSSPLNCKALLLWDVDLLVAMDLALGSTQTLNHMFLTPQLVQMDLMTWSSCMPGALQWHPHTCVESGLGIALRSGTCISSRKLSRVP